mmetsp:Transcript_26692/g.64294  ORF Transcript_26692/g.64294 Transcript_26692/m.64294 type:complete len:177 (-) Transcript_26692:127-657(-)
MFGVTALGPQNPFSCNLLSALGVTNYSDEEFFEAFQQIDADSQGRIDKGEVFQLLHTTYGFEPMPEEITLFVDRFALNEEGSLSWDDFQQGLVSIRQTARQAGKNAAQFTSVAEYTVDRRKHLRPRRGPMDVYKNPMTTSQLVGWHEEEVENERFPIRSCAETKYQDAVIKSGWKL